MRGIRTIVIGFAALAASGAASALSVEPDHPDFRSPKAALADAGRMVEAWSQDGQSYAPIASFTGTSGLSFPRKPFPPGYGRSGYEFEDEILAARPAPAPEPKAADAPAK
jgi:hypothetical protein